LHNEIDIFLLLSPNAPRSGPMFHTVLLRTVWPVPFNDQSCLKSRQLLNKSKTVHCSPGNYNNVWAEAAAAGAVQIGLWPRLLCGLQLNPSAGNFSTVTGKQGVNTL